MDRILEVPQTENRIKFWLKIAWIYVKSALAWMRFYYAFMLHLDYFVPNIIMLHVILTQV